MSEDIFEREDNNYFVTLDTGHGDTALHDTNMYFAAFQSITTADASRSKNTHENRQNMNLILHDQTKQPESVKIKPEFRHHYACLFRHHYACLFRVNRPRVSGIAS